MNIVIIGAGVVGVTQAYVLAARGHRVTLIERQPDVAAETSFANGAQLSYCYHEPIASPYNVKTAPKWLADPDGPLVLKDAPRSFEFLRWGISYLLASRANQSEQAGKALLSLGLYSRKIMESLRSYSGVAFDFHPEGILQLHTDAKLLEKEAAHVAALKKFGLTQEVLDKAGCLRVEPALEHAKKDFVGGIFSPLDASGDPLLFTQGLAAAARKEYGVDIRLNASVARLLMKKKTVQGVALETGEEIVADAVIIAAGSFSTQLLSTAGLRLPVQPMKGYSITFDVGAEAPRVSITDVGKRLVHTRLGNRMRVAGFAEFAGWNADVIPARIVQIQHAASGLFDYANIAHAESWACLRAATPDGLPVLGATPKEGLYLNTGHGMLGWTQAAGCAQALADVIEGQKSEISLNAFAYDRLV